jgi:hypothetical protein
VPWAESSQGKHFLALGYKTCPGNPNPPKREATYYPKNRSEYLLALNSKQKELTVSLLLSQGDHVDINVFLDTGATSNNYVSTRIEDLLRLSSTHSSKQYCSSDSRIVCCAFCKVCKRCSGQDNIKISINDEFNQPFELDMQTTIIDTPFDLIIGRPTIKEYGLVKRFPSHFFNEEDIKVFPTRVKADRKKCSARSRTGWRRFLSSKLDEKQREPTRLGIK